MTATARRTHHQGHAPHREVTQNRRHHPHRGGAGQQRETSAETPSATPTETPSGVQDRREVTDHMATQMAMLTREPTSDALSLSALLDLRTEAKAVGEAIPCQENDAELWFAESPADVEFAKSLCRTCPALAECFAGALERREPWGVWGGQLFVQGVVVPRKRPRGRPRKNEIAA